MHPEPHTDLDNLNTVQHNLRNSAKGSNDAYDVTVSLTVVAGWVRVGTMEPKHARPKNPATKTSSPSGRHERP